MWKRGVLSLVALLAACGFTADRSGGKDPAALDQVSSAPTAEGCLIDVSQCPPAGWVEHPLALDPALTQADSNCDFSTFPFPPTVIWNYHPNAVCIEKHWGDSGIHRQQGHDIHVTFVPRCGGQGDITEIRLCALSWKNVNTPFGHAGPNGCVATHLEVTCGV